MRLIRDISNALGIKPTPKPTKESTSDWADKAINQIIKGYKKAVRTGKLPKVY